MDPSAIFSLSSAIAGLAWLFLIAAARWMPRTFGVIRYVVPAIFAVIYIAMLVKGGPLDFQSFRTLEGVASLFEDPRALLAGWLHYLAFDFLVGCWILDRAKAEKISHWLIILPLIFTFMLGPAGWLMFVIILLVRKRRRSNP